jgi:hypothetical protein
MPSEHRPAEAAEPGPGFAIRWLQKTCALSLVNILQWVKYTWYYRTVGLFSIVFLCLCKKHPGEFCNAPRVFELYMLYDSMTLVPVVWCLYVLMGKSWHNPKTAIYYMVVNGCPLTIIRESIQWAYQLQFMGHDQPLLWENYQCFDNGSSHPIFHQGWTARGRLLTAANTTNQKKTPCIWHHLSILLQSWYKPNLCLLSMLPVKNIVSNTCWNVLNYDRN